jgi:hypothetical protein
MKMVKIIKADVRTKGNNAENIVNKELLQLQRDGNEVVEVEETTKTSGILSFLVIYENPKVK